MDAYDLGDYRLKILKGKYGLDVCLYPYESKKYAHVVKLFDLIKAYSLAKTLNKQAEFEAALFPNELRLIKNPYPNAALFMPMYETLGTIPRPGEKVSWERTDIKRWPSKPEK